jgi:hypothetical protein
MPLKILSIMKEWAFCFPIVTQNSPQTRKINYIIIIPTVGSILRIELILKEWDMYVHHNGENWQAFSNGVVKHMHFKH